MVPRHDFSGNRVLQLKLESGSNIGVRIEPTFRFRLLGGGPMVAASSSKIPAPSRAVDAGPWIALLTTGGTIASRVDYETGGVRPVKEEREILDFFPELEASGRVRIVPVFDRLSEDLVPDDWRVLAEKVVATFATGARGIVVAHGTDTLGFTAAALSFLLVDLPGPVRPGRGPAVPRPAIFRRSLQPACGGRGGPRYTDRRGRSRDACGSLR